MGYPEGASASTVGLIIPWAAAVCNAVFSWLAPSMGVRTRRTFVCIPGSVSGTLHCPGGFGAGTGAGSGYRGKRRLRKRLYWSSGRPCALSLSVSRTMRIPRPGCTPLFAGGGCGAYAAVPLGRLRLVPGVLLWRRRSGRSLRMRRATGPVCLVWPCRAWQAPLRRLL